MKGNLIILASTVACLLNGCATAPVAFPAVGPNPFASANSDTTGQLEVFSALEARVEGDNPSWFQHGSYELCTREGKLIKRVNNTVAYYNEAPRRITLSPGNYWVKAEAKDYFRVEVPVVITRGLLTTVHLDGKWTPPDSTEKTNLIYAPEGYPIGWRVKQIYESK